MYPDGCEAADDRCYGEGTIVVFDPRLDEGDMPSIHSR